MDRGIDAFGARLRLARREVRVAGEMCALLIATVFLGYLMQRLHHANLSLLFLLAVLIVAARHGLWPSVITSILGFLVFNFVFTVPSGTFRVSEQSDVATLVFFLAVAILSGNLASRMRRAITRRDQAVERVSNLYDFSHQMTAATTSAEVLQALVDHLSKTLSAETALLTKEANKPAQLETLSTPPYAVSDSNLANLRAISLEAAEDPDSRGWALLDMQLPQYGQCLLALYGTNLSGEQRELLHTVYSQAAVALDRIRLAEDLESSRRESERARLRSALLTSVSHDLRTPLASIVGASSTIKEYSDSISDQDRNDLIRTILDEARRLNGYIQNLLDMTRIEHGELKVDCEWEDLQDLIGTSIHRIRETWPSAEIVTHIPFEQQLIYIHGELFQQALHNVLDNAARYSPVGSRIEICCTRLDRQLRIEVVDQGPGLAPGERERIFDMFYRSEAGDSHAGGTGLGLAITRGIMEAHGGSAIAEAGPAGRGTGIVLVVPQPLPPVPE